MKLFSINGQKLKSLSTNPFGLEKEIQKLIEDNLKELFNLEFVKSEFSIKNFRIDTLAYNPETQSFVVIEYKKDRNFSVIDQGYTYLSIMLNNKSDFILEYNETKNDLLKREDVDWSQSRVIFVSTNYTEYQKQSVNFKDVPFELWEIKRFENDILGMIQHKNNSDESITITTNNPENIVSKVSTEIKVWNEEYHLNSSRSRPEWVNELYFELRDRILGLGEIELRPNARFVSFRYKEPIVDIVFHNGGLYTILNMKEGTLNDPNNLMKTYDGKSHWGSGDYYITIDRNTDLDYMMFLIKQSYENQKSK
ncbi:MAG TPA: hypothetical protein GXZ87_00960 [Bacteroidales bacterium]|nr:hypothetical protein [Bacteroidales bacterium]